MAIYRVQQCVFHQIEYNDMFFTLFAGELAWYYSLHPHQGVTQWASNYCTSITFSRKISLQSSKKQHTQNPFCPPKTKQKQCYNSVLNGRRRALPTFSKQIRAVEEKNIVYRIGWLVSLKNCRIVCISSTMSIIYKVYTDW